MEQAVHLLLTYKYAILFPLAIFEGPIITVVAGFLVTLGFMDIFLVYIIVIVGDFIGDTILYGLGRWGKNLIYKYGYYIGASMSNLEKVKNLFAEKHTKAVVMSKLFHGVGAAGLVAAGTLSVPYYRYIRTCFFIAVLQSAVFLFIGIVFGHAYLRIANYLDIYAETIWITALVLFVLTIIYKIFKRYKYGHK